MAVTPPNKCFPPKLIVKKISVLLDLQTATNYTSCPRVQSIKIIIKGKAQW